MDFSALPLGVLSHPGDLGQDFPYLSEKATQGLSLRDEWDTAGLLGLASIPRVESFDWKPRSREVWDTQVGRWGSMYMCCVHASCGCRHTNVGVLLDVDGSAGGHVNASLMCTCAHMHL